MIKTNRLRSKCDHSVLESLRTALSRIGPLSDKAWEDAHLRFNEYQLDAGEFFLETGEIAQYCGFVIQGVLREFFITLEGQEFNKNFNLEGEFSGSLFDLIAGEPSIASIQALTPARLLICRFADLQDLYNRHQEWEHIGRLLAEEMFMLKARREWEFMTLSAEQRYTLLTQRNPKLENRISQYHLASHLGISPVSLSRIRRRLGKPKLK
jgi:CRP-like cAMP-binding protein